MQALAMQQRDGTTGTSAEKSTAVRVSVNGHHFALASDSVSMIFPLKVDQRCRQSWLRSSKRVNPHNL